MISHQTKIQRYTKKKKCPPRIDESYKSFTLTFLGNCAPSATRKWPPRLLISIPLSSAFGLKSARRFSPSSQSWIFDNYYFENVWRWDDEKNVRIKFDKMPSKCNNDTSQRKVSCLMQIFFWLCFKKLIFQSCSSLSFFHWLNPIKEMIELFTGKS